MLARVADGEGVDQFETVRRRKDGSFVDVSLTISAVWDTDGHVVGASTITRDITEQKRAAQDLEKARREIDRFFNLSRELMAIANDAGHFVRVNPAFEQVLGYSSQELVERPFTDFIHPDDLQRTLDNYAAQAAGEASPCFENRYRCKDGSYRWLLWNATETLEDGLIFATARDVTEQKRMEQRLRQLADQDGLTGIHNRRTFDEALILQIGRCQRYGETATLLLLDLDGLKQINDTHGHKTGDDVLKAVAGAIEQSVRSTDFAARIGGDEFAVLLPHTRTGNARIVARAIEDVVAQTTVHADAHDLHPSASIGFATLDENTPNAEVALVRADRSMYAAKRRRASDTATGELARAGAQPGNHASWLGGGPDVGTSIVATIRETTAYAPSEAEREAAAVDLDRIQRGGIPLGAEQRLKTVASAGSPVFSSDLSAKEYCDRGGLGSEADRADYGLLRCPARLAELRLVVLRRRDPRDALVRNAVESGTRALVRPSAPGGAVRGRGCRDRYRADYQQLPRRTGNRRIRRVRNRAYARRCSSAMTATGRGCARCLART